MTRAAVLAFSFAAAPAAIPALPLVAPDVAGGFAVAAAASLGDLSPFRTIVADTLGLVKTGDIKAARTRIKDLESAWDKAEPTLKPKGEVSWTTIDGAIDDTLATLPQPNPKATACATALKGLLATLDALKAWCGAGMPDSPG